MTSSGSESGPSTPVPPVTKRRASPIARVSGPADPRISGAGTPARTRCHSRLGQEERRSLPPDPAARRPVRVALPPGFCAGAPFENIAPDIMICAALHGGTVIVEENGIEAAAATAVAFDESAGPQADLTLVADRPFLCAIVDSETSALLL